LLERPQTGEQAILVSIRFKREADVPDLQEFIHLTEAANVTPLATIEGTRDVPDSGQFIGSGKVEEIQQVIQTHQADLVLFNHRLNPVQARNLEKMLNCRVIDRTELILDIFAQRARSFEGKLQVELAQLKHLSSRLIRGWTHLERQRGGIGLRGPGETQLETDRRLISKRIDQIQSRLEKVSRQRTQSRRARSRAEIPVVSLVGYTNAGKSTLFNRLTSSNVFSANQLFATLDTTLRRIELPNKTSLILADTVGFVQQLPHDLVAAFRATLDETRMAEVLIHVVDCADPERQQRIEQVNKILEEIGAAEIPQIIIYNKIDQLNETPRIERDENNLPHRVWLSAQTGDGCDLLLQALIERLPRQFEHRTVKILPQHQKLRAHFHEFGQVLKETFLDDGSCEMEIIIETRYFNPFHITTNP
jgi:GTP-binding protein HflX